MLWSCVLILPADQIATGNAVGAAMGWGPDNFSVALSANGSTPATHGGLHAWTGDEFKALIDSGIYPPELAAAGITQAEYEAMRAVLIASFRADYVGHFNTIAADNGLVPVSGAL